MYIHYIFIHTSIDRHLGCFHVLALVNSGAANFGGTCIFVELKFLSFLDIYTEVGLLDHMLTLFLGF